MGGGIETIPKTVILGQSSCLMTRFYKGESSTSIWNASFQRMNEILLFIFWRRSWEGHRYMHTHAPLNIIFQWTMLCTGENVRLAAS